MNRLLLFTMGRATRIPRPPRAGKSVTQAEFDIASRMRLARA
jgi:hypothetical protein